MKSQYIVFEGTVGSGKSTQAARLHDFLVTQHPDKEIVLTREPGGSEVAEAIREVVQGSSFDEDMDPICEAYLYAASRAQSLRTIVKPALDAGSIVISDRSFISSLAFQGGARGLGVDKVLEINKIAVESFAPDIIFYIDLPPKVGLERAFDTEGDKFETYGIEFFERVDEGYKSVQGKFTNAWKPIDGNGSIDEVFERIKEALSTST